MRVCIVSIVLIAAAWSVAATATTTAPATTQRSRGRENFSDQYAALSQHNIFLRERSRPTTQRSEPARKTMEELLVLTGIVAEDEGFRAYFENQEGGAGVRAAIGEKLARGVVTGIALDAVEVELEGKRRWIETGHNLLGQSVALADSPARAAESSTTAPADGATAKLDPNDPNLSVEQRMRLRRQQETNRR